VQYSEFLEHTELSAVHRKAHIAVATAIRINKIKCSLEALKWIKEIGRVRLILI
jgi:hypothetical protein